MRKLIVMMMGLVFAASAAFASPSNNGDFTTLNKTDAKVLFGDNTVSVVALSSEEIKNTDAEGIWGAWLGAGIYTGYYGYDYFYGSGSWGGSWGGFGAAVGSGYVLFPW